MIRYKVHHRRATFQFTKKKLERVIELCQKLKFDFVFVIDQVMTEEWCLIVCEYPWLVEMMIDIKKSTRYFEDNDLLTARSQAKSYANSLTEVLICDDDPYYDLAVLHAAIKNRGLEDVIECLNYRLNVQGTGIYLETDAESLLVGTHFPTPIENAQREKEIIDNQN